jgi:hypothetical protein
MNADTLKQIERMNARVNQLVHAWEQSKEALEAVYAKAHGMGIIIKFTADAAAATAVVGQGQKRKAQDDVPEEQPGCFFYHLPNLVHGITASFLSTKDNLMMCESMKGKEKVYKEHITSMRLRKVDRNTEKGRPKKWMQYHKLLFSFMSSIPKLIKLTVPITTVTNIVRVLGSFHIPIEHLTITVKHYDVWKASEMGQMKELAYAMAMGHLPALKSLDLSSLHVIDTADPTPHIFQALSDATVCPNVESLQLGSIEPWSYDALMDCMEKRWSDDGGAQAKLLHQFSLTFSPLINVESLASWSMKWGGLQELQFLQMPQDAVTKLSNIINEGWLQSLQVLKVTGNPEELPIMTDLFVSLCGDKVSHLRQLMLDGIIGPLTPEYDPFLLSKMILTKVKKGKLILPTDEDFMDCGIREGLALAAMSLGRKVPLSFLQAVSCGGMARVIAEEWITPANAIDHLEGRITLIGAKPEDLDALAKALIKNEAFAGVLKTITIKNITEEELGIRRLSPGLMVCKELTSLVLSVSNTLLDDEDNDALLSLRSEGGGGGILSTMSSLYLSGATDAYLAEVADVVQHVHAASQLKNITIWTDNYGAILNLKPLIKALSNARELAELTINMSVSHVYVMLRGGVPDLRRLHVIDSTASGAYGAVIVACLLEVGGLCKNLEYINLKGPEEGAAGDSTPVSDPLWHALKGAGVCENLISLQVMNYDVRKEGRSAMAMVISGNAACNKLKILSLGGHHMRIMKKTVVDVLSSTSLSLEELTLKGLKFDAIDALCHLFKGDCFGAMQSLKTLTVTVGGAAPINGWKKAITKAIQEGQEHMYVPQLNTINFI